MPPSVLDSESGGESTSAARGPGVRSRGPAGSRPVVTPAARWTLIAKLALLLFIPLGTSLLSIPFFAGFLARTKTDSHFINVAGRQRMVAAFLRDLVHMVAMGQEADRPELRHRMGQFREALHAMQHGGSLLGRSLNPPDPEVRVELARVGAMWSRLEPDLEHFSAAPITQASFRQAYARIEPGLGELRALSNQVVLAFEERTQRLKEEMLRALWVVAGLTCIAFLVGVVVTRRYVVRPVHHMREVASRIGRGDYSQRLEASTRDELGLMAHSFNEMAAHVERNLLESELQRRHVETILNSLPAGLLIVDRDLGVLEANQFFLQSFGVDASALARRPSLGELLPVEGIEAEARRALSRGEAVSGIAGEVRPPAAGDARSVRISMSRTRLNESEERLVVVVEDVSESERLSREALELGRRYHDVMEHAADGIVLMGEDGRIAFTNPSLERILGYERGELMGRPVASLMPEKYREAHRTAVARCRETGVFSVVGRVLPVEGLHKSGAIVPLELAISVYPTRGGLVFTGMFREVGAQRRLEEALRLIAEGTASATGADFFLSLVRYLALALKTRCAIITRLQGPTAKQARVVGFWLGDRFAQASEMPVVGTPCERVLAGEPCFLPSGAGRRFPRLVELVGFGADSYFGIPLADAQGHVIGHLAVVDDKPMEESELRTRVIRIFGARAAAELARAIAEESLRSRELQLRQAQKMEAVGRLAGGIAHDFNNLTTAILGCSDFVLEKLDAEDENRPDIVQIRVAATRAATLTRQLLAFSRKQVLQPARVDLNTVICEMGSMLRRLIGEDIELLVVPHGEPLIVQVDRSQLEQVVMNLALNARDSIANVGRIVVHAAPSALAMGHTHSHGDIPAGNYATLRVSDTGCGMSEVVQGHLFEPFFTTKETGKGTGLGLSMVYGIVVQSGGHITVESEEGRGSSFIIYLPDAGGRDVQAVAATKPRQAPPGTGAILLVEDDAGVRDLARRILTTNGFSVIAIADPLSAVEACARHDGPIRLLLTDMVMPNLNGLELARRVRVERPGTPVLYMSGYTEHSALAQAQQELQDSFLQKPFVAGELLERVHSILRGRSPEGAGAGSA